MSSEASSPGGSSDPVNEVPIDFIVVRNGRPTVDYEALARRVELEAVVAKDRNDLLYVYRAGVWLPANLGIDAYLVDLPGFGFNSNGANTVERILRAVAEVRILDNGDPRRINFRNGMLDLSTGELGAHDPALGSIVQIPHDYDPAAPSPERFLRFLEEISPGFEKLLLELLGYSMLDSNPYQVAALLVGEGANGKSVFLNLVAALVGAENTSAVTLAQLLSDRFAPADLHRKLVNLSGDIPALHIADSSVFKAVTGGDSVRAERKYAQAFSFRPRAFSLFSANEIPSSSDVGYGFVRRWIPLLFPHRFDGEARDPGLLEELEGEIPGIIVVAIEALRAMRISGGFDPELVAPGLTVFSRAIDPVRRFVEEMIEYDPDDGYGRTVHIGKAELRQHYKNWALDEGVGVLSARRFNDHIPNALRDIFGCGEIQKDYKYAGSPAWRDIAIKGSFQAPTEAPL